MKRTMQVMMLGLAAALMPGLNAQMQMPMGNGAAAMTTTQANPAKALDQMLSNMEGEFVGLAEAMPADKYSFAPSADLFKAGANSDFTGVRTFAQQISHVTQANYHYFSQFSPTAPAVDVKAIGQMTNKEDLLKALKGSIAYGHAAIATITAQNAFQVVNAKSLATPATLAAGAVAHAFDHYGQMVEYVRMNGIVPPASAK
jgi:uncharacterized damage-inducible protein DinB